MDKKKHTFIDWLVMGSSVIFGIIGFYIFYLQIVALLKYVGS